MTGYNMEEQPTTLDVRETNSTELNTTKTMMMMIAATTSPSGIRLSCNDIVEN